MEETNRNETTTQVLRTLLNDYTLHNPTLDPPTLSLQIIYMLTTELHRLQSVITNLQHRVRYKSQRAFIRFNKASTHRAQEFIDEAHITTQVHLQKHDQSAHVAISVANVASKFSDENFKFSDEKFCATVTETAVLHPPVISTQSVSIQQTTSNDLPTCSTHSHPSAYALGENQGLETEERKLYGQQLVALDENFEDNDDFLKGIVMNTLDQDMDMPDLKEFDCFVEGLRDFLLGENALYLFQDSDIMARLVTIRQRALYEEKSETTMHHYPLDQDLIRQVDEAEEKAYEDLHIASITEELSSDNTDIDEAYLSVDSSLLEDDIYLKDDKNITFPEPEFELYHPRQIGPDTDHYGLHRLNMVQMDQLFLQLCSEAEVLLEEEKLLQVSHLREDYHIYREDMDRMMASLQLQTLMDLLQDVTNLYRWVRRAIDGEFEDIYYRPRDPISMSDGHGGKYITTEADRTSYTGEPLLRFLGDGFADLERLTLSASSWDLICEIKVSMLFQYGQDLGEDDFHDLDVALTEWFTLSRPDLIPDTRQGKHGPLLPDGRFYSKLQKQE